MSRLCFSQSIPPVTGLAERTYRCKPEPHDQARPSADAETDVADGFAAEMLL
jgi:hypothetical protein